MNKLDNNFKILINKYKQTKGKFNKKNIYTYYHIHII